MTKGEKPKPEEGKIKPKEKMKVGDQNLNIFIKIKARDITKLENGEPVEATDKPGNKFILKMA